MCHEPNCPDNPSFRSPAGSLRLTPKMVFQGCTRKERSVGREGKMGAKILGLLLEFFLYWWRRSEKPQKSLTEKNAFCQQDVSQSSFSAERRKDVFSQEATFFIDYSLLAFRKLISKTRAKHNKSVKNVTPSGRKIWCTFSALSAGGF